MTRHVQRPAEAPRRRGAFGAMALVPLVAAALVVAVGITWLRGGETGPGASPSPAPSLPAVAESPAAGSTSPEPPSPTPEPCTIAAAITSWEGAAGSRIANLTATNTGDVACDLLSVTPAELVDGSGRVLARTAATLGPRSVRLAPGASMHTMASVSNVCGEPPVAPVTIRLDFGDGRIVSAKPVSPDDTTVPPCNGPGQPSDMSIQAWSR